MTDTVKSWIEERRAIHAAAESSWWTTRDLQPAIVFAGDGSAKDIAVLTTFEHIDAAAVVDAHNMFPRALDALNAVLELHASDMLYENVGRCENYNEYHVDDFHTESEDGVEICMGMPTGTRVCRSCRVADEPVDWPCETIQAIEGAINE